MGIPIFFDQTCTIRTNTYTNTNGNMIATKTTLYSNIPCDFGKATIQANNMTTEQTTIETSIEKFDLVLNGPSYTGVRKGMLCEVVDNGVSNGEYIIVSVEFVKDWNGAIDNIICGLIENARNAL